MPNIAAGQADGPAFAAVALNAPATGLNRSSRIGLEDLSRPADARQQPSHDSVVRLAAAALKLVLLDGPFGEGRGLICRLSLVLRKRHPLANDFPTRLVVFHVCGSLGCNFSTRPEATASFTASAIEAVWCTRYGQRPCGAHRDFHRQNALKPARCHRRMVSSRTTCVAPISRLSTRSLIVILKFGQRSLRRA